MSETYIVIGNLYQDEPPDFGQYGIQKASLLVNYQLNQTDNPRGFPKIYNHLIRSAFADPECRFCWILGDDVNLCGDCLDKTQRFMRADPEIGLIFPVEMWLKENRLQAMIPFTCELVDQVGAVAFGEKQPMVEQLFAGFACACIRREVWKAVGEMDESLGIGYAEDLDYGIRTWQAGWKVVNYRQAFFIHNRGTTYNRLVAEGTISSRMPHESAKRCKAKWPFLWPEDNRSSEQMNRDILAMLQGWRMEAKL